MKDKPKHKHDCKECLFLGCSDEHDLYYCNNIHPTVIARYGDKGEDYVSGIFIAALNKHLTKALSIAKVRGLDLSTESKYDALNIKYLYLNIDYQSVSSKYNALVARIGALGGEEFLMLQTVGDKNFTSDELKQMVRLCHPDKHKGKESAVTLTQKLNEIIGR